MCDEVKARKAGLKLSPAQERAMYRLREGHSLYHGIAGRSARGGLEGTARALIRLGLIDVYWELTVYGRAWLDAREVAP